MTMPDYEKRPEDFVGRETYTMEDLLAIMAYLRSPGGCPWDRIQTHESIQGNMLEEAYEAVDAIQSGDAGKLVEELGDVLMQVVFHAGIGEEEGSFTFDQVVTGICRKLISRHTHLFGDDQADTPDMVLRTWEKNKQIEKGHERTSDGMQSVPRGMPALMRSFKLQKKAAHAGFDWPSPEGARAKLTEELEELEEALAGGVQKKIQWEAGDLLFALVNWLRHLGIDPEAALTESSERFIRRYTAMEDLADLKGLSFPGQSLADMDALWDQAKKNTDGEGGKP